MRRAKMDRSRVHDLRHTCATLLLMDGATVCEVMDQLGHSSITTKASIYGHVLDQAKRQMAEREPAGVGRLMSTVDVAKAPNDLGDLC